MISPKSEIVQNVGVWIPSDSRFPFSVWKNRSLLRCYFSKKYYKNTYKSIRTEIKKKRGRLIWNVAILTFRPCIKQNRVFCPSSGRPKSPHSDHNPLNLPVCTTHLCTDITNLNSHTIWTYSHIFRHEFIKNGAKEHFWPPSFRGGKLITPGNSRESTEIVNIYHIYFK